MDLAGCLASELVQDAVLRNIEIVGEASRNISRHHAAFAAQHPALPLTPAYEMRNVTAHGYFAIDLEVVWTQLRTICPVCYGKRRR